jgi:hypothetical protein
MPIRDTHRGWKIEGVKGYHRSKEAAQKRLAAIKAKENKPAEGKRFVKEVKNPETGRTKKVSYGQAGKAKDGGDRIRPSTKKADAYCARSYGIKKGLPKDKQNDPNTPNNLSRKKWKCSGKKSRR